MDYAKDVVNAGYIGGLSTAQSNALRPETGIENIISRLSGLAVRVQASASRGENITNKILGFIPEKSEGGVGNVQAISTSVSDLIADIDAALNKLEYHQNRLV